MRLAALVKQIPDYEELELGPDGRLRRDGLGVEMNPYCRRAVAEAVLLAAEATAAGDASTCTFVSLGPPSAEDTLREALAWALDRGVTAEGILVSDPAFAGSDTLATATALAATLQREGPFDLVLVGRSSVDSDTGQVGPQMAELLDVAFLGGARHLHLEARVLDVRCEQDDGWLQAQ